MDRVLFSNSTINVVEKALRNTLYHHVALHSLNRKKPYFIEVFDDVFENMVSIPLYKPLVDGEKKKLGHYFIDYINAVHSVALDFPGIIISKLYSFSEKEENIYCCMKDVANAYIKDVLGRDSDYIKNHIQEITLIACGLMEGHETFASPERAVHCFSRALKRRLITKFNKESRLKSTPEGEDEEKFLSKLAQQADHSIADAMLCAGDYDFVRNYLKHTRLSKMVPGLTKNDDEVMVVNIIKEYRKGNWDNMAKILGLNEEQIKTRFSRAYGRITELVENRLNRKTNEFIFNYIKYIGIIIGDSTDSIEKLLEDYASPLDKDEGTQRIKGKKKGE